MTIETDTIILTNVSFLCRFLFLFHLSNLELIYKSIPAKKLLWFNLLKLKWKWWLRPAPPIYDSFLTINKDIHLTLTSNALSRNERSKNYSICIAFWPIIYAFVEILNFQFSRRTDCVNTGDWQSRDLANKKRALTRGCSPDGFMLKSAFTRHTCALKCRATPKYSRWAKTHK